MTNVYLFQVLFFVSLFFQEWGTFLACLLYILENVQSEEEQHRFIQYNKI